MFYKSWSWKWSFRLLCKFSLHFRKISCFISKNILSKVVLKYEVLILTYPSNVHPAYPKIHFRIMRIVNPLSQLYINRKLQKYISVSICHCHRASFMRSLFIAFKNDGVISWYVLALQRLFHFIACVSLLPFALFFLMFFVESCWGFEISLTILIIKQCTCS